MNAVWASSFLCLQTGFFPDSTAACHRPQVFHWVPCPFKCNLRYFCVQSTVLELSCAQSRADSSSDHFVFHSDIALLLGFVISFDYVSHFVWFPKVMYFHHVTAFRWSRPAYLALDSLLSPSRTLLTCLMKYFPLSCSIFTPFWYTLQGHEHPGSFSSLLAISVAVQSRVCLDYQKFVLISKYTSFFCAKVSCLCVGSFSVVILSFFIPHCPLHILKHLPRFFPWFFGSGFTSLIIIHIHTTSQTFPFVSPLLSSFSLRSTLSLFIVFIFSLSSEFISVWIPFLRLSHGPDYLQTLLLAFRIEQYYSFSLSLPSRNPWDEYHLTFHTWYHSYNARPHVWWKIVASLMGALEFPSARKACLELRIIGHEGLWPSWVSHGSDPCWRKMRVYVRDSMLSQCPNCKPRWLLIEVQVGVPTKERCSCIGIWMWDDGLQYLWVMPKSIRKTMSLTFPVPIRMLCGLISQWIK